MEMISAALLDDGRILVRKFREADEIIDAGELDFWDFSSPLARKVIYIQRQLSRPGAGGLCEENKVGGHLAMTRHFLTELMTGMLTMHDCRELKSNLRKAFPRLVMPKSPLRTQHGVKAVC